MTDMAEHLYKGPILQTLDAKLGADRQFKVDYLADLEGMKPGDHLEDVALKYGLLSQDRPLWTDEFSDIPPAKQGLMRAWGVILSSGNVTRINEVLHMRYDWYTPYKTGDTGGWWQDQSPSVEEIVRQTMIEALKKALYDEYGQDRNLPIVTNWMCVGMRIGEDINPVEGFIDVSSAQITVVILTPEHPYGPMGSMSATRKTNKPAQTFKAKPAVTNLNKGIIVVRPHDDGTGTTKTDVADFRHERPEP